MLAIISDLHLDDETLTSTPLSPAIARNFRHNMSRLIQEKRIFERAKQLELCFLGDCLDLIRSDKWLREGVHVYPWSEPSRVQEEIVIEIVDQLIEKNQEVLHEFRKLLGAYDSRLIYVYGNHDWLVGTYRSIQTRICKALGLSSDRVQFCEENTWTEYYVYAYHGHSHDPRNYDRDRPSLGTMAFVLIFNRLPYDMAKIVGQDASAVKRIQDLISIELSGTLDWFDRIIEELGSDRELRRILKRCFRDFFRHPDVTNYYHRASFFSWTGIADRLFQIVLLWVVRMPLWLTRLFSNFSGYIVEGASTDEILLEKGYEELDRHTNKRIRYVVCGHTHIFRRVPLGNYNGRENYYLNTGAWGRNYEYSRKRRGGWTFSPRDSLSYLVFYKKGENSKYSFEVWNGSLGPAYEENGS